MYHNQGAPSVSGAENYKKNYIFVEGLLAYHRLLIPYALTILLHMHRVYLKKVSHKTANELLLAL